MRKIETSHKDGEIITDSDNVKWMWLDGAFIEYTAMNEEECRLLFKKGLQENIGELWKMLKVVNGIEEPSFSL